MGIQFLWNVIDTRVTEQWPVSTLRTRAIKFIVRAVCPRIRPFFKLVRRNDTQLISRCRIGEHVIVIVMLAFLACVVSNHRSANNAGDSQHYAEWNWLTHALQQQSRALHSPDSEL